MNRKLASTFAALLAASILLAWAASGQMAALYVFLGAATYSIVYTVWLKRRTSWNIVVGGLAGSFAVLAGSAAVDPGLQWPPVILATVLFLWTPPHFWSLAAAKAKDYAAAGFPMLPVVAPFHIDIFDSDSRLSALANPQTYALVDDPPVARGVLQRVGQHLG